MTINGFGILLILIERIKRDISKLEKGLQRTTGRVGKKKSIEIITKEEESWKSHR